MAKKTRPTLAELKELPLSLWPTRVGRYTIRRGQGETPEQFRERVFDLYEKGKIKDLKPKGPSKNFLSKLDPEFVREFRMDIVPVLLDESPSYRRLADMYGEGDVLQMLAQQGVQNSRLSLLRTPRQEGLSGSRMLSDNLQYLRIQMGMWVSQTKTVKACEARCDLDCLTCSSPQILSCASDNITPAEDDDFDLFALLTDPTYGT